MSGEVPKTRWLGLCAASGLVWSLGACSTQSDPPIGAGAAGTSVGSGGSGGSGGATGGSGGATGGSGGATGGSGGATTGSAGASGKGTGGSATGGSAGAGTAGGGGSAVTDAGSKSDGAIVDSGTRNDASSSDATVPPGDASSSTGCGAATWPASGNFTIDVAGTMREYIVKIPAAYDTKKPYKLIFTWHGLGGTAQQIAQFGYYGLESLSGGSSIFVSGQGLDTGMGGAGWPNTNGQDVNFVKALVEWMKKSYCVDETRIFSVGMSYGGIMSNTLGCQMGNVFRAIAPMSGSGPFSFGTSACTGQHVAAWLAHGTQDTTVPFDAGAGSRDHWRTTNHCAATSAATPPAGCVSYDGCDPGYPVHWCAFDGGHTIPTFAPQAIWNFLAQF